MKFGLQLFSLRDDMAKDHIETIQKVGAMGYENVEFAGYFGETGKSMRELLEKNNLKAVSSHIGYQSMDSNFKGEVEFNHEVGNDIIILPYYPMQTLEDAKRAMDKIAGYADAFTREGFKFGYHNHDFEFKPLDDNGTCSMDLLLQLDNLLLQPDLFWVKRGGLDPLQFIKDHGEKIVALHLKEYGPNGENSEFGNGILPWKELVTEAEKFGVDLGIIEQEAYTCAPIDSVKICIDNLKKIFG